MGKINSVRRSHFLKLVVFAALVISAAIAPERTVASDLQLATASPLVGFTFDDKPLTLPVQRNFQMAMLTASSELGRSCGKMEAYGWRMNQSEQARVNQIFNSTVDRLRGLGYEVQAQAPSSVSRDITMFTADRSDGHFHLYVVGRRNRPCHGAVPIFGSSGGSRMPTRWRQHRRFRFSATQSNVMQQTLPPPAG